MMKRCAACGNLALVDATTDETRTVSGIKFEATLPVKRCRKCGEDFMAGPHLHLFEVLIAAKLGELRVETPEAMRFMRKALGIRSLDFAVMLGTTPETVSRWEHGTHPAPRPAFVLLGLVAAEMAQQPVMVLERMKAASSAPARKKRAIRIDVPKAA